MSQTNYPYSLTRNHRLILRREWIGNGGIVNWIMLNPSTADEVFDDPTIRKCIGFSKRWGFRGLVVTNLFTFRATKPADLRECAKRDLALAVGLADEALIEHARTSDLVMAAWGNHGDLYGRADDVLLRVIPGIKMHCIGFTKKGLPLHPLMAAYTDAPVDFEKRSSFGPVVSAETGDLGVSGVIENDATGGGINV